MEEAEAGIKADLKGGPMGENDTESTPSEGVSDQDAFQAGAAAVSEQPEARTENHTNLHEKLDSGWHDIVRPGSKSCGTLDMWFKADDAGPGQAAIPSPLSSATKLVTSSKSQAFGSVSSTKRPRLEPPIPVCHSCGFLSCRLIACR